MRIDIAERLRPFSHESGASCLLPFSSLSVQVFPARLILQDLAGGEKLEIALKIKGPVKDFTVVNDLEKGAVTVFGSSVDGFFRYHLFVKEEEVVLFLEKGPADGIPCKMRSKEEFLKKDCSLPIRFIKAAALPKERLSLGMHKSQDWQLVKRRHDFKEIFPHWVRLAEMVPSMENESEKGMFSLVKTCKEIIDQKETTKVFEAFTALFLAGFKGILVPRLQDDDFQGIVPEEEVSGPSLALLQQGASMIRSLFYQDTKDSLSLLPCLPPECHAGRYTGICLASGNKIDFEWSKKLLRRAIIRSYSDGEFFLNFQKPIKTFRLRRTLKEKGIRLKAEEPIFLEKGAAVYIDCIQK